MAMERGGLAASPPFRPLSRARVASLRCPILRSGDTILTPTLESVANLIYTQLLTRAFKSRISKRVSRSLSDYA